MSTFQPVYSTPYTSLPSPPLTSHTHTDKYNTNNNNNNNNVDHQQHQKYNPTMISPISRSISSSIFEKQLDNDNHQHHPHSDLFNLQLKPLLLNKYEPLNPSSYHDDHHHHQQHQHQHQQEDVLLPSIHKVMTPPLSSKNSPPLSYHSNHDEPQQQNNIYQSTSSSFFISVPPSDIPTPPHSDLCLPLTPHSSNQQQRKGSIASLLNSDPELKSLDEEEYKCGYQSHFMNPHHDHDMNKKKNLMKRSFIEENDQQQTWIPDQSSKRKKLNKQYNYLHNNNNKKQPFKNNHHEDNNNNNNTILSNHFPSPFSSPSSSSTTSPILSSSSSSPSLSPTPSSSMLMGDRATKGLRHFSKQVCDKVKEYGITTHDQVVKELTIDLSSSSCHFDQKNIRRRVYDALNVITAMGIIEKDKKVIKWLGIPTNIDGNENENTNINVNGKNEKDQHDQDHDYLMKQIHAEELKQEQLYSTIHTTRQHIQETLTTYLQLCRLIQRNRLEPELHQPYSHFPLMIIDSSSSSTMKDPIIETSKDFKQAMITFNHSSTLPFQPHTFKDVDILKYHFSDHFTSQELSSWLPNPHWQQYLEVS